MDTSETGLTRRGLMRAGAGAVAAAAVGTAATGGASAQEYDGYLDETGNFEGTADATGLERVPLTVGAGAQGLLFGPTAALLVDPGTTIEWTWTGEGGAHNVVHDVDEADRVFDSANIGDTHDGDSTAEEGFVYEVTLDDEGVYPYVCTPHRGQNMQGVIVVGEDNVEGDLIDFDFEVDDLGLSAVWGGAVAFGLVSFLGLAAYRELSESDE